MKKFIFLLVHLITSIKCNEKLNVILILADDLGFNDVSFHGSFEIPTPNLDALCYNGVILNRMYTTPLCTPSRSSLLTAKYPTKLGMQHYVIPSDEPWGLPLNEKLMPEYFKEAGYKTVLVGKWHLGFFKEAHTPTNRGFDYHFGYLGPYIGYYDHSLIMLDRNYSRGYDMRRNLNVEPASGKYATDLFTDEAVNVIANHNTRDPLFMIISHLAPHTGNEDQPMEAPENVINKFNHIKSEKRRTLAAMISVLDEGIGRVVEAVKHKNILNNTIIVFLSDNGGPTFGIHSTEASNYPLRGQKGSVWEGGCRVPACIYSSSIKNNGRITNEFMHITDILPTLASAANITTNKKIDGINQWKTITDNQPTTRKDILYNIESELGFSGIMSDGWKLVNGTENINYSQWFGSSGDYVETNFDEYYEMILNSRASKSLPPLDLTIVNRLHNEAMINCSKKVPITKCNPLHSPCLFNIINDPCEMNNLADEHPEKIEVLIAKLKQEIHDMIPSIRVKFSDPQCDPKLHNNVWQWWKYDEDKSDISDSDFFSEKNILIIVVCFLFIAVLICIFYTKCRKVRSNFTSLQQQN